jgi:hypothetical protein
MRISFDVHDEGEGILQARAGDVAFVAKEDAAQTSDWVWVKVGTKQGYVPRSYLVIV